MLLYLNFISKLDLPRNLSRMLLFLFHLSLYAEFNQSLYHDLRNIHILYNIHISQSHAIPSPMTKLEKFLPPTFRQQQNRGKETARETTTQRNR